MTTSPSSLPRPSAGPLFDSIGQAYEQAFQGLPSQLESIEWILSTAPANSSVLDIGTGTGRPVASTLSSAGHRVLGIDVSPTMISCAKSNVPSARFQCVDVRDFVPVADEPEQQFDVIVAYFSLIACLSQQELKGIIRRIGRELLKPGGIFVWGALPIDMEQETIEWMGKGGIVASALSREESLSCLREDAGLEVVREWESTFFPEGAVEAGICEREKVWEETHLIVWAKKPAKG